VSFLGLIARPPNLAGKLLFRLLDIEGNPDREPRERRATMVARKKKPAKKVKSLPARNVSAAKAKGVKGGADMVVVKSTDKATSKMFQN
jgi:hypothetical protein